MAPSLHMDRLELAKRTPWMVGLGTQSAGSSPRRSIRSLRPFRHVRMFLHAPDCSRQYSRQAYAYSDRIVDHVSRSEHALSGSHFMSKCDEGCRLLSRTNDNRSKFTARVNIIAVCTNVPAVILDTKLSCVLRLCCQLDAGALLTAFSSSDCSTYADICRCSPAQQNSSKATFSLSDSSFCVYLTALRLNECTAGAAVKRAPSKVKSTCTTAKVQCCAYKYQISNSFWCQPAIWTQRAESFNNEALGCM